MKTDTRSVVRNMVKSRELSQKLRKEVNFHHSQAYGYKMIAKTLNISRDTVGSIVRKYKAKGTVATLLGRGRRSKLSSSARRFLRRQLENKDYFMVGEYVRFLFTSCEGSLNERVSAANE